MLEYIKILKNKNSTNKNINIITNNSKRRGTAKLKTETKIQEYEKTHK